MDFRFPLVHVERGAGDQVLLECPGERLFVDDRPARRVHEVRGSLHPRQRTLVDQVPRLRRERHVDAR